jgi:cellulose synthase/poly-beta-1,6-N-acetylglucosamine synthase-like glycosyltransferase
MTVALVIGGVSVAAWVYLLLFRGMFWLMRERDDRDLPPEPAAWPAVVAVAPARNEADVIERSVTSLLSQDYAGTFRLVLVDDNSEDGTDRVAMTAAARLGADGRWPRAGPASFGRCRKASRRRAGPRRPICGSPTQTSPMRLRLCAVWSPAPRPDGWRWSR